MNRRDFMIGGVAGTLVGVGVCISSKKNPHACPVLPTDQVGVPVGGIVLLAHGASVPDGWQVCNGENGVADLQEYADLLRSIGGPAASPFTFIQRMQ